MRWRLRTRSSPSCSSPGQGDHGHVQAPRSSPEATGRLHDSIRTEDAYVLWVKRFVLSHGKRHSLEMGEPKVVEILTHLVVRANELSHPPPQVGDPTLFVRSSRISEKGSPVG